MDIRISQLLQNTSLSGSDQLITNVSGPVGYITKISTLDSVRSFLTSSAVNSLNINSFSASQVTSHLVPSTNETLDLGSATNKWRDLYLSGTTIYLGTTQLSVINDKLAVDGNVVVTASTNGQTNLEYVTASNITGSTARFASVTASFTGSGTGLTNIPNIALVNSAVTVGTTVISLGDGATTIQGVSVLTGSTVTGSTALFTSITASHSAPLGSAASPSYSFTGQNTGIFSPSTNILALSTSGSEWMRIDGAGRVGINTSPNVNVKMNIGGTLPSNAADSVCLGVFGIVPSSSTNAAVGIDTSFNTQAAPFTLSAYYGCKANGVIPGSGSTVTNQYAFVAESSFTAATNNYGFYGNIPSGTGRWNFYAGGTADNYFAGRVGIGTTPVANTLLDVNGTYASNIVAVAALNIDCSLGNYFTKTINGASTFTVSNVPASRNYAFTLELEHTSGAITWFSGVEWPGGTAPTLTTGKTHLFIFQTDNGGTRWRASSLTNYTT